MAGSEERLSGGALNAALANELGKLIKQNLVAAGRAELVRLQRDALERAMGPQLIAAVEHLSGRRVRTFMRRTDEVGGSSVEAFVLDPELAEARVPAPV